MIYFDASVAVKWFKKGERHEKESMDLLTKIIALDIDAASSEWTSIEIVRGLKRAQNKGEMNITDTKIEEVFQEIEDLFETKTVQEIPVSRVKTRAKECEIKLSLSAADAVHLASAIEIKAKYLVTDDDHLLKESAKNYVSIYGLSMITLPEVDAFLKSGSDESNG